MYGVDADRVGVEQHQGEIGLVTGNNGNLHSSRRVTSRRVQGRRKGEPPIIQLGWCQFG